MYLKVAIFVFAVCGLVGCQATTPKLTSNNPVGRTPVPTQEVVGLFRHICLADEPAKQLVFPFVKTTEGEYRHADFDLSISVSNDQVCEMIVKPTFYPERSLGNQSVDVASAKEAQQKLAQVSPNVQASIREDNYVIAKIKTN